MKMPEFAGNAVYAKLHCIYGRRLTAKNYNELLTLSSVNEVAEYLKTKTAYSEIFEGLSPESPLQRTQIENLLFNKMYNDLSSVIRFEKAAGSDLYKYFIMKYDTLQLIKVLGSLKTKSDTYFFSFPVFYNERSLLNLYKTAQAKNEDELLETTKRTIYYDTFRNAVSKYRFTGNLTAVQAEFSNFLDDEFIKLTAGKKKKNIPDNDETGALYKALKDITLIKTMYRITRFETPEILTKDSMRHKLTLFTKKQLDDIKHSRSKQELFDAISKTYLSSILTNSGGKDFSHTADEYIYDLFSKAASRSTDHRAVMFACVWLTENEIKNIIHIIEGIRCGMSPIEILPMLCGISNAQ